MKKSLLIAVALCIFLNVAFSQEGDKGFAKLSPRTQLYMQTVRSADNKSQVLPDYVYKKTASGMYMSAMIKVNKDIVSADLEAIGVHVGTRAGKVWTTIIPIANVEAFTRVKGIDYIELDEPVRMNLDSARKTTRADSVQLGIGLPHGFSGKGVVVGVVDVGFDYGHPTFYDTSGTNYRIRRIWEEKTIGTPPAGFAYGHEISDSNAIISQQTDNNVNTHGTHVCGIAAGSGYGSTDTTSFTYRGMAYESDIVLVGIMPDSSQWQGTGVSDFIDGMNYVFTYAASVGKPAVVNLSWGSVVGPRDGSSLFSEACDALVGPGKIFVVAAGNEGGTNLHLQKAFTATDTVVSTFPTFDGTLNVKKTWIDMWGDSAKNFCVQVGLYNNGLRDSTGFICLDNNLHSFKLVGANHDTCYIAVATSTSEFNGRPRVYLTIYSRVAEAILLTVKGNDGHVDMWTGYISAGHGYSAPFVNNGLSWATAGDDSYTTSDMVSSAGAISAGAYSAKVAYRSISGQSYNFLGYTAIGQLVPFSSHGPTADGRIKPDITAPGLCVVSSVSSYDGTVKPLGSSYNDVVSSFIDPHTGNTYYWAQFSGTSMATPCTSGIIALMLQANPNLSPAQVTAILAQTAILDTATGALPVQGLNTWGHGKINAYGAVVRSLLSTGVGAVAGATIDCKLYPNPSNGRSTLSYTGDKNETLSIEMYDITGKQTYADDWKVNTGANTRSLDLSKYSKGMYLVKVSSAHCEAMIKVSVAE